MASNERCPKCGNVILEDEPTMKIWTSGFYQLTVHLPCFKVLMDMKRKQESEVRVEWRKEQEDEA